MDPRPASPLPLFILTPTRFSEVALLLFARCLQINYRRGDDIFEIRQRMLKRRQVHCDIVLDLTGKQ